MTGNAAVGSLSQTFQEVREASAIYQLAEKERRLEEFRPGSNGNHKHSLRLSVLVTGQNGCEIQQIYCNYGSCTGLWKVHSQELPKEE